MSLKNNCYTYIPLYMHTTLPTLGNEKEQQQIKLYEKTSGELTFSWSTKTWHSSQLLAILQYLQYQASQLFIQRSRLFQQQQKAIERSIFFYLLALD